MSEQLVVAIKSYQEFEDLLPYLEDVARPDMKVIFLVSLGANRFAQLAGLLLEIQSGLPGTLYGDTVEQQSHLTHRIKHASESLSDRGLHLELKFYSGPLRRILRQCIEGEAGQTVIMRPRVNRVTRLIKSLSAALRLGNPSRTVPVVLCQRRKSPKDSMIFAQANC